MIDGSPFFSEKKNKVLLSSNYQFEAFSCARMLENVPKSVSYISINKQTKNKQNNKKTNKQKEHLAS